MNEADVSHALEKLGFETVLLGDHSVQEQADMFAEASHVIGPHGAGLGNLVFAGPGTKVLELFSAHVTNHYWVISNQMDLEYHAFECMGSAKTYLSESDITALGGPFQRNWHDIYVPVDELVKYIEQRFLTG